MYSVRSLKLKISYKCCWSRSLMSVLKLFMPYGFFRTVIGHGNEQSMSPMIKLTAREDSSNSWWTTLIELIPTGDVAGAFSCLGKFVPCSSFWICFVQPRETAVERFSWLGQREGVLTGSGSARTDKLTSLFQRTYHSECLHRRRLRCGRSWQVQLCQTIVLYHRLIDWS